MFRQFRLNIISVNSIHVLYCVNHFPLNACLSVASFSSRLFVPSVLLEPVVYCRSVGQQADVED